MIKKAFSKRAGRELWGFDARVLIGGKKKRIEYYEWETKRGAEEALAAIRRKERDDRFGVAPARRPRLVDLIEQRLRTIDDRAERTRSTRVLKDWLSLLGSDVRVDEITSPSIRLYVEKREQDHQSASSIGRELNIIGATLNAAGEFFPELAQWRKPKIPRPKIKNSRRERIITDQEYQAIMAQLTRPPDEKDAARKQNRRNAHEGRLRVAAVFKFAMNTGMRPKEIFHLQWADIDSDNRRIRVYASKTDANRYVPLTQTVQEVLESQRKYKEKRGFIFTEAGIPSPKFYRIIRTAVEAAGIVYGKNAKKGLVLYCARHTFTTRLLQRGIDLRTVGDITGHTDRELVLHYSHVTPESTSRAAAVMDEIENGRAAA
jgi:integrase